MSQSSDKCPFGNDLQKMWDIRGFLLTQFANAQFDEVGLYSITPEPHALEMASDTNANTVLDICCGLGGNSIAFARAGKKVIAVDINKNRITMARHNSSLYGVQENIKFVHASAEDYIQKADSVDMVFLDPPWGKGYGDHKKSLIVRLEDMSLNGADLRQLIAQIECKNVMIKVPSNFFFPSLRGISIELIREHRGLDGRHIFSSVLTTKDQFIAIPQYCPE